MSDQRCTVDGLREVGMKRHELSDESWRRINKVLPRNAKCGRPPRDGRLILNGILWLLRTGVPWRDLPERFGPWETVYGRFRKWTRTGFFQLLMRSLVAELARTGELDRGLWCVDGTVIRASHAASGARCDAAKTVAGEPANHALGYSQGGFSTKVHLVCDSNGLPLAATLTPGQAHESKAFESTMNAVRIPLDAWRAREATQAPRWRQGVQLSRRAEVAARSSHPGRDRTAQGPSWTK